MSEIIDVSATAVQDDRSGWQAEDGIRVLRMSRGLGDVYKRQELFQCITVLLELPNTSIQKVSFS